MRRLATPLAVVLCLAWVALVVSSLLPLARPAGLPPAAEVPPGTTHVVLSAATLAGRPLLLPEQRYAAPRSAAEWTALERQAHLPRLVRNSLLAATIGGLALSLPLVLALLAWTVRALMRPFRARH
ncbi:hypothetical protein [Zavarzinia sp. CC-PAN008]|uniref:hypothetical protein n=1 Tax=Zavarzinia sp. CC-PAN008 TaxID=3243332 RepID=UPI003F747A72